ncbi:TetR/AcrR family transcriptional regulator [Enterococcus sp. AZ109]|uniref:TetR/AcrR family transcriptional regulator n=1 Tax=Enterococcus sp. AZ109 TaxID=2774634 RepID=UPI003F2132F3
MVVQLLELDNQRRDAVLNAALKEFALKGYDQASTNQIAKDANMSKALMFHYVKNKQELFLTTYQYFTDLLEQNYFRKLDFKEHDIFLRLRQSYLLQLQLIKQYPWILEFDQLSVKTNSVEINREVAKYTKASHCNQQLFEGIDTSKFRPELAIEKSLQFILWANIGFTDQLVEEIKLDRNKELDDQAIIVALDDHLNELKKLFYSSAHN